MTRATVEAGRAHDDVPPVRRHLLRPTHPVRAAVFIALNLLAYGFANVFLHYLSSGRWVELSIDSFGRAFSQRLGEALLTPLSMFGHPWMIPIFGVLLAVVMIVPLLVACLYPSRIAALFLLCSALLGQAPVLTLFLAGGCVLVAATPLRSKSPMLALLLGLAPLTAYLYFSVPPVANPIQQFLLHVPFVAAMVGAVLTGVAVLLIARLSRYRPGVIPPVVLVLLAAPVGLFYSRIGADELSYALLARRLTYSEGVFADQSLQDWYRVVGRPENPADLHEAVRADLEARQRGLLIACEDFIRRHGRSRRLSAVLWIKGITQDTRVHVPALQAGLLLKYYDTNPQDMSHSTWRRLAEEFPGDPRAGVACYRLAQLAAQRGQVAEAVRWVEQALENFAHLPAATAATSASGVAGLFQPAPGVPSSQYLRDVADQAATMHWLIRVNRVQHDPLTGEAFAALMDLDPHRQTRRAYRERILRLAERYRETPLADNFALALAMGRIDDVDRVVALLDLCDIPGSDASIQANYELGYLALRLGEQAELEAMRLQSAAFYFSRVAFESIDNPWQRRAAEHFTRLQAPPSQEDAGP